MPFLGDNTDYWVFIARIFEDTKPRWFSRLEAIRKTILLHTDPNKKYENGLRGHQGKLSPDTKLKYEIERLAEELLYEAKQPTETSGGEKTNLAGGQKESTGTNRGRKKTQAPEGELSKPMQKKTAMSILGFSSSYKKFRTWKKAKDAVVETHRGLIQIRLDKLDPKLAEAFRAVK